MILDFLSQPTKYEAVYKKYAGKKFMKCAIFVKDWIEKKMNKQSEAVDEENDSEENTLESCE